VAKFKCLGRLTDKFACTKSKLNSGNGYCQSVLSPLPSRLVYRNVKVKIYKTIILTVVLYGCETWSLTLREEHRLRVFENRVLRKKFVPKRQEITGQRRKFNNEYHHNLYSSPNIIMQIKSRRMRWAGHAVLIGGGENCTRFCWESQNERDHLEEGVDGRMGSE
jgi:hypothetical protein